MNESVNISNSSSLLVISNLKLLALAVLFFQPNLGASSSSHDRYKYKEKKIPAGMSAEIYSYWKHAVETFESRRKSVYHFNAFCTYENLHDSLDNKTLPIDKQLDTLRTSQAQENRKTMIKTKILCGQQGIALRGHDGSRDLNIDKKSERN
ncbi:hypothetical protein J437_LFUL005251 [Ladona fulva]|uniref:Uncharacterized protein n=1 Tax=Ladona fulva TaxID=123851 RepID=A0A8K0JYY2_LADFU|nr:hypothetical protein J437_LFUL005251 [Ladona fulva]